MTLDEARGLAGQVVSYRPAPGAEPEYGAIIRTSDPDVFVRFTGDHEAKACAPETLTLELGTPLSCDRCHMPARLNPGTGEYEHVDVADAVFCGIVFKQYGPGSDDVSGS